MKKAVLLYLLAFTTIFSFAQINSGDKYFIQFTDKDNSPYSIENPEEYLSQRALDRRERYGIAIDIYDLPVNPQYIEAVANIGVDVMYPTKWFNGIVIQTGDPSKITEIEALPFVAGTVKNVFFGEKNLDSPADDSFSLNKPFGMNEKIEGKPSNYKSGNSSTSLNYGEAYNQIDMIGGIALHDEGYQGQGMVIAILDGGFTYTDQMAAFDTLYMNNRILSTKDFVGGGTNVYQGSTHGTSVLSTIAANLPGQIVGTAPAASFHLVRTEDTGSEYLIEEYNWVSGAEYADSAGADVINSSLSYKTFDDPAQDHSYQEMDGNTAPSTRGADRCMSRGMIVVNSAGNDGNSPTWPWVGAPADGDSVFSIGSVNAQGIYSSFSSIGPTADGRLKPNVTAQGSGTVVASINGGTSTSSGTSFSSPIIAGMTACLWQVDPSMNNMDILNAIQMSASQAANPDELKGYGIPNYGMASIILSGFNPDMVANPNDIEIFPNPFTNQVNIVYNSPDTQSVVIEVADLTGKEIYRRESVHRKTGLNYFRVDGLENLKNGIYILKIYDDDKIATRKIMKFE
ncbi:MAG: S8 family peptidase [Bacteroidales bacterium]|nr:S8 family peptidase [Bacteroidales bacterium]